MYNDFVIVGPKSDPAGIPLAHGEKIADPKFLDFANRDLHLKSDSPAIAAGEPNDFHVDFDDQRVPEGKAPDLGAYEFRGQRQ